MNQWNVRVISFTPGHLQTLMEILPPIHPACSVLQLHVNVELFHSQCSQIKQAAMYKSNDIHTIENHNPLVQVIYILISMILS
jgi:hypothetical protein